MAQLLVSRPFCVSLWPVSRRGVKLRACFLPLLNKKNEQASAIGLSNELIFPSPHNERAAKKGYPGESSRPKGVKKHLTFWQRSAPFQDAPPVKNMALKNISLKCCSGKHSRFLGLIQSHLWLSFWLGFTCNRYSRPKIDSSDLHNQICSGLETFVLFSIRFAGVLRLSSGSGMSSSGDFRHHFRSC